MDQNQSHEDVQQIRQRTQQQMMNIQISQYMTTPQGQAQSAALFRQYLQKAAERYPGGVVPDAVKPTIKKQAQAFMVNQLTSTRVQSSMQQSVQQSNTAKMTGAEESVILEDDEGEARGELREVSFISCLISL
jgi:hypothetical protein